MEKVKIKLITIGHLPLHVNLNQVSAWQSDVFELVDGIDNLVLRHNSDGPDWEFSDELLRSQLPENTADFLLAIVNVPIEARWYSRRLGNNRAVFTFNQIREYLAWDNIPLENAILRVLYAYTLVYLRSGKKIPDYDSAPSFTHDETRGCLFDMNGIKSDLVESCNKPVVCSECEERLKTERIPTQTIETVQKEIRKIRKRLYYRAFDFIKAKPLISLAISSVFAMLLGITGSLVASYIYDSVKSATSIDTIGQPRDSIASGSNISAASPVAQGKILSPQNGEEIPREVHLQGTTNDIPQTKERWILVYATVQKRWYPIEIIGKTSNFEQSIQVGRVDEDHGQKFKVSLFITDNIGGRILRTAIKNGLDHLPDGTEVSEVIVIRNAKDT